MIDLPNWIDPEVWGEFEKWRKKARKPLTNYARKLAVDKLWKLWQAGNDPTEVLNQSIMCGYLGLFEIHQGQVGRRDQELRHPSVSPSSGMKGESVTCTACGQVGPGRIWLKVHQRGVDPVVACPLRKEVNVGRGPQTGKVQ